MRSRQAGSNPRLNHCQISKKYFEPFTMIAIGRSLTLLDAPNEIAPQHCRPPVLFLSFLPDHVLSSMVPDNQASPGTTILSLER